MSTQGTHGYRKTALPNVTVTNTDSVYRMSGPSMHSLPDAPTNVFALVWHICHWLRISDTPSSVLELWMKPDEDFFKV
jgi:hypothetical protein